MHKIPVVLVSILSIAALSACSTTSAPITKTASKTPPRLIIEKDKNSEGDIHPMNLAWNKVDNFGAVPASLQKQGDSDCKAANFTKAVGYHPKAEDVQGKPIPGGAFLCDK